MMQVPLFVGPLTEKEQAELEAGRRSSQGFTVRRSQMLLESRQGKSTTTIARLMGCTDQTVRTSEADKGERKGQGITCPLAGSYTGRFFGRRASWWKKRARHAMLNDINI